LYDCPVRTSDFCTRTEPIPKSELIPHLISGHDRNLLKANGAVTHQVKYRLPNSENTESGIISMQNHLIFIHYVSFVPTITALKRTETEESNDEYDFYYGFSISAGSNSVRGGLQFLSVRSLFKIGFVLVGEEFRRSSGNEIWSEHHNTARSRSFGNNNNVAFFKFSNVLNTMQSRLILCRL
jgi:hypothetical protein